MLHESFFVDEYSKLDGKWELTGSLNWHITFLNAKKYCSKADSCFGIEIGSYTGSVYSINFPTKLSQQGGTWYIHKKNKFLGIFD